MKMYARFGAMIATSTITMLALMYLNTYQLDHVSFSETRAYMALVMGAAMAIIMLAFMLKMYTDRRVNIGIFVRSVMRMSSAVRPGGHALDRAATAADQPQNLDRVRIARRAPMEIPTCPSA